jgi:hypothetical protein
VTTQVPLLSGLAIQSPRKKPSYTFSDGPPPAGTRRVSQSPSCSDENIIHRPSGDHTGHESAAASFVNCRRSDPSTYCTQTSELPV